MRSKAQAILETSGAMRALPRTLALELKAELIRQLCDELLAEIKEFAMGLDFTDDVCLVAMEVAGEK